MAQFIELSRERNPAIKIENVVKKDSFHSVMLTLTDVNSVLRDAMSSADNISTLQISPEPTEGQSQKSEKETH